VLRIYGRRPLTRLEAALYAGFTAVLIAIFLERVLAYMVFAERMAMEATVNQVMSGANRRLAYDLLRGARHDSEAWKRRNPFELAGIAHANFAGELDTAQVQGIGGGAWAFDRERGELIYRPRLRIGLQTSDPDGVLRFRGSLASGALGYTLVPATSYQWD